MRLTNAEKLVMKCIWDTPKDMMLSEIVSLANERYQKDWRPQTVSTYLAHIVRKGFLAMTRTGKIYTYHPLISESIYFQKVLFEFKVFWEVRSVDEFLAAFWVYNKPECLEIEKIKTLINSI